MSRLNTSTNPLHFYDLYESSAANALLLTKVHAKTLRASRGPPLPRPRAQ